MEKQEGADKLVVQHQQLSNLLQAKEWSQAVRLALRLSQHGRATTGGIPQAE